jgi:penicillin-binding protein 2
VLGLVFLAMFAALTLRLWQIQVASATDYEAQADNNQVKLVSTPAPRGEIRDRNGELLAGTRSALAAVVDGALVTDDTEEELIQQLAAFSPLTTAEVRAIVEDARDRGDRRTVVSDISEDAMQFIAERKELFPGVSVVPQPIRIYPEGELASDILGYIGLPDQGDIDAGKSPTELLGKAGIEKSYDDLLRGVQGTIKYQVNARQTVLRVLNEDFPKAGASLTLNIDLDLQRVVEQALADGLDLARSEYDPDCVPSDEDKGCPVRAVGVVLNATNGAVEAMASVPTYDPNIFVDGITTDELERLNSLALFNNFAIQGEYAPASTFKVVTYVTAMEENIPPEEANSVEDPILCSGQLRKPFTDPSQRVWNNWTRVDDGMQSIHEALMRSCNVYFWDVAYNLWQQYKNTANESLLQDWARRFGFDAKTGIDLPFEKSGIIPDRELFERWKVEEPNRLAQFRLDLASPWLGGDLLQAAVGQGSVVVTPIQLATAYAAMVNGGTVWQPRVLDEAVNQDGEVVFKNEPTVLRQVDELSASTVKSLRRDLQAVVNNPRGTAHSAFVDFGPGVEQVGGKTGTAEVIKRQTDDDGNVIQDTVTTALFAGVTPINDPEHVVVVIIERGGSGGGIAAPTAKPILQHLMGVPVTDINPGVEAD